MNRLYLANCTRANHVLNIRVPEGKLIRLDIPSGQQRQFPVELTAAQKDVVLHQLHRIGAVPRSEVHGKLSNFTSGIVYSLDKPLNEEEIHHANEDNLDAAQDRSVIQAVRTAKSVDLGVRENNSPRGKRTAKSVGVEIAKKDDGRGQEVHLMGVEIVEGGADRVPA